MSINKRKVKTYAKLISIGLLVLLVLIFMASNRERVMIKFLVWDWQLPLFGLIFLTAILGIFIFLVCRKIMNVVNEFRQIRREEKSHQNLVQEITKQVRDNKST